MSAIVIRRVCTQDAMRVRDLRLQALAADPLAFGSNYAKEVAFPESRWIERAAEQATSADRAMFLASAGETIVGMIVAVREEDRPTVFGVFAVWVAPEVRRNGVATRLLETTEAWIETVGGTHVELLVSEAAPNARRMYERAGWVADSRLDHGSAGQIERGMTKTLRAVTK